MVSSEIPLHLDQELGVGLVDESGQITTVVEDQVGALAVLEGKELLLEAPLVLLLSLTLPGKDLMHNNDKG